jgi:peptide chain release factor subunit 3
MDNNNKAKLNLNLGAKGFVPKTYGGSNQNNNNQMNNNNNMNNQNTNYGQQGYGQQGGFNQGNQGGYNPYQNNMMNNQMGGQNNNNNNMNQMNNNMGNMNLNNNYNQNQMNNNQFNNNQNNNNFNQQPQQNFNNTKFTNQNVNQEIKKEEPTKKILTNPNFVQKNEKKETKNEEKKVPAKNKNEDKKTENIKKKEEPKQKKVEKIVEIIEKEDLTKVQHELVKDSKRGEMIEVDQSRQPCSIVFIGHVDHGKSTIAGNILISTGQVDQRTLDKYQKEAKTKNRDSWYIAYIMDSNEDEREKGKTVEIGKAFFRTEKKRYTILDAPGHTGYLPNMLQGACQADFAGLVISAKTGEFEAGFEKSGSTREHVLLTKSLGVSKLVVLVNKMDEESVKWSETRFNQIRNNLSEYLKKVGYNIEKDVVFVPISGLYGDNLKEELNPKKCSWYKGPTLLSILDDLECPPRDQFGPLRMTILDRYREGGMYVMGKIESGQIKYNNKYTLMPTKRNIEVEWIYNSEEQSVPYALPGETVRVSFL